jgi:hypothetical protein
MDMLVVLYTFLSKKVLSFARYGLYPLRKLSVQGFKAKENHLVEPNLSLNFVMINYYNTTRA